MSRYRAALAPLLATGLTIGLLVPASAAAVEPGHRGVYAEAMVHYAAASPSNACVEDLLWADLRVGEEQTLGSPHQVESVALVWVIHETVDNCTGDILYQWAGYRTLTDDQFTMVPMTSAAIHGQSVYAVEVALGSEQLPGYIQYFSLDGLEWSGPGPSRVESAVSREDSGGMWFERYAPATATGVAMNAPYYPSTQIFTAEDLQWASMSTVTSIGTPAGGPYECLPGLWVCLPW